MLKQGLDEYYKMQFLHGYISLINKVYAYNWMIIWYNVIKTWREDVK